MAFAFSMRGACAARSDGVRVLTAPEPNATLFGVLLCLPTAPALPAREKGDFVTSPFFGRLSVKQPLASNYVCVVP